MTEGGAVQIIKAPPAHVHVWSSWRTEPDSRPAEPRYRTCYGCGVREEEEQEHGESSSKRAPSRA
jgi:hypothetical protein